MRVHRAFDVMAPMDVHSARCLAIQPGRAASSPQELAATFLAAVNAQFIGLLRFQSAAIARNDSRTAQVKAWKIRGI